MADFAPVVLIAPFVRGNVSLHQGRRFESTGCSEPVARFVLFSTSRRSRAESIIQGNNFFLTL